MRQSTSNQIDRDQDAPGNGPDVLIDVSRLIWRVWTGRLPTGIDRVCLAYLDHFNGNAQAVVQRNGYHRVLSPDHSQRLFELLRQGGSGFRAALLRMVPGMVLRASRKVGRRGRIYLNIGHTGLDDPALPAWVARNGIKAVHLIHDLIPISHPEFCRAGEAEKHEARMANALKSAAGIIGNSQATLAELQRFAERMKLPMPPRIDAWISGHGISPAMPPSSLGHPYFVTVGTIEGRKNHILLLNVWHRLIERMGKAAPRLIIIGQRGWEAGAAIAMLEQDTTLKGFVRELGQCEDDELARLIAGSRALLMPSFAEGFGLPVVESLQFGTPVIVSDLPVFREIAGDIPTYLDPHDGGGWEQEIVSFMDDVPERQRQIAAMQGYRAPDWNSHFQRVDAFLQTL